ncbi:MAG: hypothetical protein ACLP59_34105 [Bryobacteraceae bacterium]
MTRLTPTRTRRRLFSRGGAGILLAVCLSLPWIAAAQTHDHIPDPIPVKARKLYRLPFFCIEEGLLAARRIQRCPGPTDGPDWTSPVPDTPCALHSEKAAPCAVKPKKAAKKSPKLPPNTIYVPPGNADDIAKQLTPQIQTGTPGTASVTAAAVMAGTATASATGTGVPPPNQFPLAATADKRAVIIFFRDKEPGRPNDLPNLEKAIYDLAKPKYAYFKDYTIHSGDTGKKLTKVIPAINAKLKGEVITTTTIRVESDAPLTDADLAAFEKQLTKDRLAIEANEIYSTAIPDDVKKDLKGPDPDVEVNALDMPYLCQANDLKTAPVRIDPDKDPCAAPSRKVQAGNSDAVLQAVTAALGKGSSKITLTKDGYRILIACDGKCDPDALQLVHDSIATTARPVPLLVEDLTFPRGTTSAAARVLTGGPVKAMELTDTLVQVSSDTPIADDDWAARLERVRQRGFGPYQIQPLQRMFYQSAGAVVGDLLTTPPPGTPATLGGDAAASPATSVAPSGGGAPPAAAQAATTTTTPASGGTTISITNNPPAAPAAPTPAAPPTPGPAPTGTVGLGMTAVDDNVVFTDTSSTSAVKQRSRLLTMLDMPRPEVLMNMWSFQASSSNGKEIERNLQHVRDLVSANNDALQHAIDYGWAYLSRQMRGADFFDPAFYDYVTQRFVADTEACEAHDPSATGCLTDAQRKLWGLCPSGQYCLGYEGAFQPARPSLTGILLGMMASKNTGRTVLTTIGCMEGRFEVYGTQCFPDRDDLKTTMDASMSDEEAKICIRRERAKFLEDNNAGMARGGAVTAITKAEKSMTLSCELLDRAAVAAERACGLPVTLPLSCFTLQAAKTFLPDNSFSTFPLQQLNSLAEDNLADLIESLPPQRQNYSTTGLGLLRSAVADFLFHYKIAIQFPNDLNYYSLPHSAQELNTEFNPLVNAFNQDVAALSRTLLDEAQSDVPNQNSFFQLWRRNKSYIANGLITVRGISGVESLVDTDTQNAFDSTQAQTLGAVLSSITGSGAAAPAAAGGTLSGNTITINPDGSSTGGTGGSSGGGGLTCTNGSSPGSPLCAVAALLKGTSTATGIATALAAITPTQSHSIIGRQLTLDVIPHTLPGASSAELDVRLWAQEDSAPTIYSETGPTDNDYTSRVARHNVATRVRVDSVKLFDVSTFTAMVQRPRTKLPIVPPFIEIPLIGSILSVPLPAAKIYHASSAIVSAIIVPTAADLGYGIVFQDDRAVFREDKNFSRLPYTLRVLTQHSQYPETAPVYEYHGAMVKCLATSGAMAYSGTSSGLACDKLKFSDLPPTR